MTNQVSHSDVLSPGAAVDVSGIEDRRAGHQMMTLGRSRV